MKDLSTINEIEMCYLEEKEGKTVFEGIIIKIHLLKL